MANASLSRAILIATALIGSGRAVADAQIPRKVAQAQMVAGPTIPDVVGKTAQAATTALAVTKLSVISLDTVVAGTPSGVVVAQRPAAGTLVSRAKELTILIARPPRRLPSSAFVSVVGSTLLPPTRVDTPGTRPPPPRDTLVPDLFGRTPNAVAAALEASRLRLGSVSYDSSDRMRAGYAFEQKPQPNTRVGLGSAVDVVYSLGPHQRVPTATVPLIETKTVAEAMALLKRANLRLGRVDTLYQPRGDGRVAHQEPHAGVPAHPLDAVDATIALPPPLTAAPNVVGMSRAEAVARIERVGFDVGEIRVITRAGAKIAIDSQRPAAGTRLPPHALIDLVEVQPAQTFVVVPSLAGRTEAEAKAILAADSLSLGKVVRPDDDSAAKILAQQPGAGQTVLAHSLVAIRLAPRAPSQQPVDSFVPVPSVVNSTVAAAQQKVSDAGFSGTRVTGGGATGAAIVTAQSPAAGELVTPATVITVKAETVIVRSVPDLVGRTEDGARSAADRDHFLMAVNGRHRRLIWSEAVISQAPPAGAPAPGDRTIGVDLEIPVVPPVPAALTLGFLGATEETVRRWRRRHRQFAFDIGPSRADLPSLSSSGGDRLIRSVVEFVTEPGTPTWDITPRSATLVKTEKVRNG